MVFHGFSPFPWIGRRIFKLKFFILPVHLKWNPDYRVFFEYFLDKWCKSAKKDFISFKSSYKIRETPITGYFCFFERNYMKASFERFSTPQLNDNIIQRIKIVMEIDRLSKRGILFIHSPAGYGKTTAVALWAQRKNTAWLSLDEYSCNAVEIYKQLLLTLSCRITASYNDAPLK